MNEEREDGRLRFVRALRLADSQTDAEGVMRCLDETPIALVIGSSTADTFNTQVTALTALNLLGRLFRHLFICVPPQVLVDTRVPFVQGQLADALLQFATRVSPQISAEPAVKPPAGAVALHISDDSPGDDERHVYCMGAGWLARVWRRPLDVSAARAGQGNPIGPLIAAALGVAEVFKLVFGNLLQGAVPVEDMSFSALTYQVQGNHIGPNLGRVTLPPTLLVGAGSIGSSFLWGLAHLRKAQGTLTIVDHDKLEKHNPDRAPLVLDDAAELKLEKAPWARDTVQPWLPKLKITPFPGTLRQYIDTLPP
ncbi:MAG TPA: ThiF family adenylyltransferase, partial [Ktedonobacteraceae bacterium]|nr:ThiF family adenylyltransferase [Ktedonobacteraceae bacterium]